MLMGTSSKTSQMQDKTAKHANSLSLLHWCYCMILLSVFSWVLLTGYATVKVFVFHHVDTIDNIALQLNNLTQQAAQYDNTWLGISPTQLLSNITTKTQYKTRQWTAQLQKNTLKNINYPSNLLSKAIQKHTTKDLLLIRILILNGQYVLLKCILVIAALPWFVLSLAIGLADGLMERAIRKAELARESTFIFHKLGAWCLKAGLIVWFCYLIWSTQYPPLWCIALISLCLGLFSYYSSARFKKYL